MSYVPIPFERVAIALLFIATALFASRKYKLGLEWSFVVGAVRAAVQLIAIGYALVFLFKKEAPWNVSLTLIIMLFVAAWTSARRIQGGPSFPTLFTRAMASIFIATSVAVVPLFVFIVKPSPWFEARYLIPISGMMMSSAMNVVAQVFERVFSSARLESAVIEQMLALGASSKEAMAPHVRASIRAAMIPTLNGLLTVGLVALPGMMTGQVLSGTSPDEAIRYQIVIMYQLVAVAAVAGVFSASFARQLLFTGDEQMIETLFHNSSEVRS